MFTFVILFAALCVICALAEYALMLLAFAAGALCTVSAAVCAIGLIEWAVLRTHNVFTLAWIGLVHVVTFVFC